jgi:hypothetical protein
MGLWSPRGQRRVPVNSALTPRVVTNFWELFWPLRDLRFSVWLFGFGKLQALHCEEKLGQVKGVDGIKTGYTEASGYNLVSSVRRDDRHIVAVVLGGTSNAARDARMRQLIEDHISQASPRRTVSLIMQADGQPSADAEWALYLAAQALRDDRWRCQMPSRIAGFYGNFGLKRTDARTDPVGSEVGNFFSVIGPMSFAGQFLMIDCKSMAEQHWSRARSCG